VRANHEAMQSFGDEGEGARWIDPAKVGLEVLLLLLCFAFGLILDGAYIFGDLFEAEAFHPALLSLGLVTTHQVRVEDLGRLVSHGAADKEFVMEERNMLYLILKFHKDPIL
jgi:hypothetical protein